MKTEIWNGHEIRFVEKDGEWCAIAKDITDALGFRDAYGALQKMPAKYLCGAYKVGITSDKAKARKTQNMILLNEKGLYRLIMRSNKPEAEAFQDWVYELLRQLRQSTGLEGFQIFRMLDKEHQKEAMARLNQSLHNPVQVSFIKANTIANKAVSIKYGYPKMVKKGDMSPEMLKDREPLLDETVELMRMKDKYSLDISVSEKVYQSISGRKAG